MEFCCYNYDETNFFFVTLLVNRIRLLIVCVSRNEDVILSWLNDYTLAINDWLLLLLSSCSAGGGVLMLWEGHKKFPLYLRWLWWLCVFLYNNRLIFLHICVLILISYKCKATAIRIIFYILKIYLDNKMWNECAEFCYDSQCYITRIVTKARTRVGLNVC